MKILRISISIVLLLLTMAPIMRAEQGVVVLSASVGTVLVKSATDAEWNEAKIGQTINPADTIKTEDESKAALIFPDKSSVILNKNSELVIEELDIQAGSAKTTIFMRQGGLKAVIAKLEADSVFKIRTPTAISTAKGTICYVSAQEAQTSVYVEDGIIELVNVSSGESRDVFSGQTSDSNASGAVSEPSQASQEQIASLNSAYSDVPVAEPYSEPGESVDADAARGVAIEDIAPPEPIAEGAASPV